MTACFTASFGGSSHFAFRAVPPQKCGDVFHRRTELARSLLSRLNCTRAYFLLVILDYPRGLIKFVFIRHLLEVSLIEEHETNAKIDLSVLFKYFSYHHRVVCHGPATQVYSVFFSKSRHQKIRDHILGL